jgi:antitoxin component of MazEF toxin-antitoxin module
MVVTVRKIGGSAAVVIPKGIATQMQLGDGTPLEITATREQIVMRKSKRRPRRSLASIVKQIRPAAYRRKRDDCGGDAPVGREVW